MWYWPDEICVAFVMPPFGVVGWLWFANELSPSWNVLRDAALPSRSRSESELQLSAADSLNLQRDCLPP